MKKLPVLPWCVGKNQCPYSERFQKGRARLDGEGTNAPIIVPESDRFDYLLRLWEAENMDEATRVIASIRGSEEAMVGG